MTPIYILLTMDCETAKQEVTSHGTRMSASGPHDYAESERSIQGYASIAGEYGLPLTLFVHPEVALGNRDLLLGLQGQGHCLGLHLHPYKFAGKRVPRGPGCLLTQESAGDALRSCRCLGRRARPEATLLQSGILLRQ